MSIVTPPVVNDPMVIPANQYVLIHHVHGGAALPQYLDMTTPTTRRLFDDGDSGRRDATGQLLGPFTRDTTLTLSMRGFLNTNPDHADVIHQELLDEQWYIMWDDEGSDGNFTDSYTYVTVLQSVEGSQVDVLRGTSITTAAGVRIYRSQDIRYLSSSGKDGANAAVPQISAGAAQVGQLYLGGYWFLGRLRVAGTPLDAVGTALNHGDPYAHSLTKNLADPIGAIPPTWISEFLVSKDTDSDHPIDPYAICADVRGDVYTTRGGFRNASITKWSRGVDGFWERTIDYPIDDSTVENDYIRSLCFDIAATGIYVLRDSGLWYKKDLTNLDPAHRVVSVGQNFEFASDMAILPDGTLVVAGDGTQVVRVDPVKGTQTLLATAATRICGVATKGSVVYYLDQEISDTGDGITMHGDCVLYSVRPDGTDETLIGTVPRGYPLDGRDLQPNRLVYSALEDLFFTIDEMSNTIIGIKGSESDFRWGTVSGMLGGHFDQAYVDARTFYAPYANYGRGTETSDSSHTPGINDLAVAVGPVSSVERLRDTASALNAQVRVNKTVS